MKSPQYLITTTVAGKNQKIFWDGEGDLVLDHASPWSLFFQSGHHLKLRNRLLPPADQKEFDLSAQDTAKGFIFTLPAVKTPRGMREVRVHVTNAGGITPPYLPLPTKGVRGVMLHTSELYVHAGVYDFLLKSRRFGRGYAGKVAGKSIFVFGRVENFYKLKSHTPYLTLEKPDGRELTLKKDATELIEAYDFENGTLSYGNFWWRVNHVNQPPPLTGLLYESLEIPEGVWIKRVTKSLIVFIIVAGLMANSVKTWMHRNQKPPAPPVVGWKQPKFLPPPVTILPPVPIEKPPAPKPAEPKPEKPKKAEPKPTPIPRPKTKPVPRKPVAAVPPTQNKPVAPAPNPQAELAKSLSFLTPSKVKTPTSSFTTSSNKYKATLTEAPPVKNTLVKNEDKIADVDLRNTREINADSNLKGKQLNDVRGKVSLDAVSDPNAKADLGGASGLSLSGEGALSEAELQKALSKKLSKFQYCYEKALLNEPTLSGVVTLQWTISTDGQVSEIKTVSSQIASAALQSCLKAELTKITFPKPKGGSVVVKFPFSFTSS
jgi:hypothetical protein